MRLDFNRRNFADGAEDIGTWQTIFEILLTSAVVTNAAMIVFTMEIIQNFRTYQRFWIFIGFQWVIFSLQFLISLLVPDVPAFVDIQMKRNDFINHKIFLRESDSVVTPFQHARSNLKWHPNDVILDKLPHFSE
jgi:hypothetical protein